MNLLVIDCAVSRLSIAAKADNKMVSEVFDIGMRQSEILVPTIQEVLKKVDIEPKDLDYTALTIGPGSFTGLRLGISALKAIELAYDVPVYGVSSLKVYRYPFESFNVPVLSCIDANKDKFYAGITHNSEVILEEGDWTTEEIISKSEQLDSLLVTGPDASKLSSIIKEGNNSITLYTPKTRMLTTDSLINITEELIKSGAEPIKDFDGPVYLRASEAELKLNHDRQ